MLDMLAMFLKLRIKIFAKMLYSMYSYLLNMVKYTLVGYHSYLCVEGDTSFETVFHWVFSFFCEIVIQPLQYLHYFLAQRRIVFHHA